MTIHENYSSDSILLCKHKKNMKLSTKLNIAELLSFSSLRGIGNYSLKTLAESNLTFEELIYSSPDLLGQWIKGANRNDAISGIKSLT